MNLSEFKRRIQDDADDIQLIDNTPAEAELARRELNAVLERVFSRLGDTTMSEDPVIRVRLYNVVRRHVSVARRSGSSQTYWGVTRSSARRLCAVLAGIGGTVMPFPDGWEWRCGEEPADE